MTLSDKTVLVTGATGFLGGHLVNRLAEDGVQVKALARRPERDRYIRDAPDVEVVQGNLTDADRMREVAQSCTVIFHVGAALGGDLSHQRRVNVEGTRHIMQAAAAARVERVVHVSTISTYGYRNRTDVTEDTPPDPGADPYHITKVEAEQVVRQIGAAENVDYTIIRPGMIYGPRSTQWTKTFFNVARRGLWIGDGSGSAFPIYVDDVVDLCITAATHPAAVGEVFNCTPDPSPTWRQFLGAYQQLAGVDRWIGVPPLLLRPAVMLAGVVAPKHSKAKDLPDLLPFVTNHITYKMEKARDLLGWQPQVELSEGVARCVPYLREKGLLD